MRMLFCGLALLLVNTSPAAAQVVTDMTPERIKEAITLGSTAKELPIPTLDRPHKSGFGGIGVKKKAESPMAAFSTPYLRVALAAYSAKRKYKTFSEADVTPAMVAPEVYVYAYPAVDGAKIASVETVVILPAKEKDRSKPIQPTRTTDFSEEYQNLLGFRGEGKGLIAIFPLDVLKETNELHVVYDHSIAAGAGHCDDCARKFDDLKKVR